MTKKDREAIAFLELRQPLILLGTIRQSEMNILSDHLRLYLGDQSKIYQSFADIDLSMKDGKELERASNATELLQAAIQMITLRGVYQDVPLQLSKSQLRDLKYRNLYLFISLILGWLLSNAKEIGKFLLAWHHQAPSK
jgi:hypothetical protein